MINLAEIEAGLQLAQTIETILKSPEFAADAQAVLADVAKLKDLYSDVKVIAKRIGDKITPTLQAEIKKAQAKK